LGPANRVQRDSRSRDGRGCFHRGRDPRPLEGGPSADVETDLPQKNGARRGQRVEWGLPAKPLAAPGPLSDRTLVGTNPPAREGPNHQSRFEACPKLPKYRRKDGSRTPLQALPLQKPETILRSLGPRNPEWGGLIPPQPHRPPLRLESPRFFVRGMRLRRFQPSTLQNWGKTTKQGTFQSSAAPH